jgi:hypothetical protein
MWSRNKKFRQIAPVNSDPPDSQNTVDNGVLNTVCASAAGTSHSVFTLFVYDDNTETGEEPHDIPSRDDALLRLRGSHGADPIN